MASSAAQLRAEIADLSLTIDLQQCALDESRAQLAELQEKLRVLPYPNILRLPLEITAEVFQHFALDRVSNVLEPNHNGPLLLTWVCAEWRRIALSTPVLWSTFAVETGKTSMSDLLDLSRIWAERAMACQRRSLRIEHLDNYWPESFRHLLDLVREASDTVVSLDLKFYSEREYLRRLDELMPSFPQLENLTLGLEFFGEEDDQESRAAPIDFFRDCPRLRRLHVDNIPVSVVIPSEHGRITQLEANFLAAVDFLAALTLLPNLVHCTFWANLVDEDLTLDAAVSHHNIRTFDLSISCAEEPEPEEPSPLLLDLIVFPSLERLEANIYSNSPEPSLRQLQAFMKRSSARLQTLIIKPMSGAAKTQPILAPNLLDLPVHPISLTTLRLTSASMGLMLSSLRRPNVETVEFFDCDPYSVWNIVDQATDVIQRRRAYALGSRLAMAMKALELSILRILKIRLPGSIKSRLIEAITASLETSRLISLRYVRLEFPDFVGYSPEPFALQKLSPKLTGTIQSLRKASINLYAGTDHASMLLEVRRFSPT
uniref:F-box domain-containing protein n=1 Tax=Mycena chlorophos TaxID=658473 RepID=A0ABQ0LT50_MYCCL|nr:predicted protein [Mycena chlorophos]